MTIPEIIARRAIVEVVHYTTHQGLAGIAFTKALKCKNQLRADQYLEHILKINTQSELDPDWNGHVHLSISRINSWLFGYSWGKWHRDAKWRILAFDPLIATHPGVHFGTTNNAYPSVLRAKGGPGLEALFAGSVAGRYGAEVRRTADMPSKFTTCEQAEILYPGAISVDFLRKIYVPTPEDQNVAAGALYATGLRTIDVVVAPERFVGMKIS